MAEGAKDEKYLDRYEVVAVALPGAALLLFLWHLEPSAFGTEKFELKDVSLGALGIFAIAGLIAGQVVQALANLAEELFDWLADIFTPSPVASLPPHRQRMFLEAITAMGVERPEQIDRRRYRKELNKDIIGIARRNDPSGVLQVFNVTYGLNRGLSVASGCALVLAIILGKVPEIIGFAVLFVAMTYRATRFSRRYEGEKLRRFIDAPRTPAE